MNTVASRALGAPPFGNALGKSSALADRAELGCRPRPFPCSVKVGGGSASEFLESTFRLLHPR